MNTEEREKQFAQRLSETLLLARRQGNTLTKAQIAEAFAPLVTDEQKLEAVTAYFRERRVLIGNGVESGERDGAGADGVANQTPQGTGKQYQAAMDDAAFEKVFADCLAGSERARNTLIEAYLPMVEDVSRLYLEQGVLQEDLIGEGNVALVAGASLLNAYETAREAEEGLFRCVMGAMEALVHRTMREKADDEKTLNRVREMAEKTETLAREYGRDITAAELADETDWTIEDIREVLRLVGYELAGLRITEDLMI